ncbi:MAG: T9SS type A sorting domain-containing protein [Bacteroidetes bacterium]|nr:T9SS type A sorting domain-containing protein [Bacteroidota bacterium]
MKFKIYFLIVLGFLITQNSFSQILRSFTTRYNNPSVKGNIVYVSNSIVSTNGVTGTGEVPPSGTSTNNGNPGININVDGTTIIPAGSSWKYWSNTQANYQPNWETVGYNDAAWPSGNGELGYGDGDEATCIPSGGGGTICTPTGNKWVTAYFRKTINIPNPSLYSTYTFNVERDDGFVIYVNGVEVGRDNMPAGAVSWSTAAISAVNDAIITVTVPSSAFVAGNNVIAVEVHQATVVAGPPIASTSSDLSFNLELSAKSVFNSSTSDLNLPGCSQVLFAGLYWGAGQGSGGTNTSWITGETTCKLKVPGASSYTNITSTQTDYFNSTLITSYAHSGYLCYANITSLINTANPNGTYTLANVVSPVGINDAYGGWTIVIVYSNPTLPTRNLSVFDGCAGVKGGSGNVDVNITGFLTPPAPSVVSCELGAVAYDGDRGSPDAYSFKQNGAGSFYDLTLSDPTCNPNDMWNSTISYKGNVVTTRNPAYQNTLGYDADIIDLPNAGNLNLSNNQTSATVRFSSPSENYLIHVVTTSISQFSPSFSMDKTATDVNGGSLMPGDILRYQIAYTNVGNDTSINSVLYDNIPSGTSFVPGSIKIGGVAKTDASGDDQADYSLANNQVTFRIGTGATAVAGGAINNSVSGTVQFDVVVGSSAAFFSCGHTTSNSARVDYTGKTSGLPLNDSSGTSVSGCFVKGPVTNTVAGVGYVPSDTSLVNLCPSLSITLPWAKYAGYSFYTAMPFVPANRYNPYTPVTATHTYYAYYNSGTGCSDTIKINVFINGCPDIDDDKDGIPDYVEINLPAATQDADGDGIPNWKDTDYPGFVDNNIDGSNDNFDPAADSDNDGIPNFLDVNFPGYVDTNGDRVNDNMDKDLDGIPNNYDVDSDNDGIPDVVEAGGVDANGDGRIDNFTDTDNDGLSQNVDASNTGILGSGNGLGFVDKDGDGIPNYLDLDSDNDGIPDVIEAYGTDTNNDGKVDSYTDTDGDGFSDNVDGDVGNDGVAENASSTLLRTGADTNSDGRADSYPYKNMDADSKANPYDLDSDGDGITDVKEAFPTMDTNSDGRIDGAFNANGWSTTIAALGSLSLPNTDASGRANVYDIDSDDDGIPDNIEGLPTAAYVLPSGSDTDLDGIDNSYDNYSGFGGNGIPPVDTDGDGTPDYKDLDTDGDGVADIYEGNDYNNNGLIDDGVALTGVDTDGDGLDNFFDLLSTTKGTSAKMGNGGSFTGDASPGSKTSVQRNATHGCATERDWRCVSYILKCNIITFKGSLENKTVSLEWAALCDQDADYFTVERSIDGNAFTYLGLVEVGVVANKPTTFRYADNISLVKSSFVYYRLKTVTKQAKISYSSIVAIPLNDNSKQDIHIVPNPVTNQLRLTITSFSKLKADVQIFDENGRMMMNRSANVKAGTNYLEFSETENYPMGVYYLRVKLDNNVITRKFNKVK